MKKNQLGAIKRAGLVLVGIALTAVLVVKYQQGAAAQAGKLAEFCAAPATGNFSIKLACIPRRDQ